MSICCVLISRLYNTLLGLILVGYIAGRFGHALRFVGLLCLMLLKIFVEAVGASVDGKMPPQMRPFKGMNRANKDLFPVPLSFPKQM